MSKRESGDRPGCSLKGWMTTKRVFEVTGRHVNVCIPYTTTSRDWNNYNLTTYRRTGGGNSVSLFSDKWHPDSWEKKCWGPWTDFSVIKIKCVGLDKDRHFTFYFWTPTRALTNATPPPLRLCHDCFCSPEMSYSYRGDNSIWHKQTPTSSKCT